MDLKAVEKVVGQIQSNLFKRSNSYSAGLMKSHFKGSGIQFKEHRVYEAGDDVRFIDWKVSAKINTPFVKTFEEERNVHIVVVIDLSEAMLLGYKGTTKLQASLEIACLLMLIARQTQDQVKIVLLDSERRELPFKNGKEGIVFLVATLEKLGILLPDGRINLNWEPNNLLSNEDKIKALKTFMAKKREVIFLSDLSSFDDLDSLRPFWGRKNFNLFQVLSPLEKMSKLPFMIQTKRGLGRKKGWSHINASRALEFKSHPGLHQLDVSERYLDLFVKGLI